MLLTLAGVFGIVIVSLTLPDHRIDDASFARLREGMTLPEVEALLGVSAGDYRVAPVGSADGGFGPTDSFGPSEEPKVRLHWYGDARWIHVGFDGQGKVVAGWCGITVKARDSFLRRLGRWFGLGMG